MKGILADNNVERHLERLVFVWHSPFWLPIWNSLSLAVHSFADLGLAADATDLVLWQTCQRREIVLLTANRNADGPDSLETTIRHYNAANSLPVFTVANADRILQDSLYAHHAAEKLLEYLLFIDEVRGAGRLFVP